VQERLQGSHIASFAEGGAELLEVFAARGHFDYCDATRRRELAGWLNDTPALKLHSLHAPLYSGMDWGRDGGEPLNIAAAERRRRVLAMDEIKRAIETAEQAPFPYLVQHIGEPGDEASEAGFEAALSSVEHLKAFAKPLGVTLLLENTPNASAAPERLLEILRIGRFPDVGLIFDIGHARLGEGVSLTLEQMAPHLRSTHLHDNHGEKDEHLWPGEGAIDWPSAVEQLNAAPHKPAFVLEIAGDPAQSKLIPERMQAAWKKLGV